MHGNTLSTKAICSVSFVTLVVFTLTANDRAQANDPTSFLHPVDVTRLIQNEPSAHMLFEKSISKTASRELPSLDLVIPRAKRVGLKKSIRGDVKSLEAPNYYDQLIALRVRSEVDLRYRDSAVKSQIGGVCTAFGLVASLENLMGPQWWGRRDFSENHFWSMYQQYSVYSAIEAALKPDAFITPESSWPQKSAAPLANYKQSAKEKLTEASYLEGDIVRATLALNQNHPVYIGMSVPKDMSDCRKAIRSTTAMTSGGHALEVVGYKLEKAVPGGGYFILKNSWGTQCGDSGYQYMPFGVCDRSDMYCVMWDIAKWTWRW